MWLYQLACCLNAVINALKIVDLSISIMKVLSFGLVAHVKEFSLNVSIIYVVFYNMTESGKSPCKFCQTLTC